MNNANINLKTPLINRKPLILVLNLYVKSFFKKKKYNKEYYYYKALDSINFINIIIINGLKERARCRNLKKKKKVNLIELYVNHQDYKK
jgi:hypothetical protein